MLNYITRCYKNPAVGMTKIVIGGISFGVASDVLSEYAKKKWATSDVEKIYNQIKGIK